ALEQLSGQLAKYLSPQVYESIFSGRSKATVASRRKKLTIFFSDLEGFTETTERLESEDLTQLKDAVCCEERGHINVKGISHPVATYQVIDVYDNVGKSRDLIHEDYGTLKLDIDLEAMSASERSHAVTVLQRAVDRLSDPKQAANPSIIQQAERQHSTQRDLATRSR